MADARQLVTFQLGEELYGINIMDVKEIVRAQTVRAIPHAPDYVEGIFNLRSEIIPIVNLHARFHLRRAALSEDDEPLSGFIILDIDGIRLGVIIDRVSRVVTVRADDIQRPPQMVSGIGAEYIQGVVRQDDGYLIVLEIRDLFNTKELRRIDDLRIGDPRIEDPRIEDPRIADPRIADPRVADPRIDMIGAGEARA